MNEVKMSLGYREALELLKEWFEIHDSNCRYDHHGYCQEHFLQSKEDCIVEKTKKFIEES